MNFTIKSVMILFLFYSLVSCDKEDVKQDTSKFLGPYKLTTLNSNKAIDINQDGVAEFDFVKELNTTWFENDMNVRGRHQISIRPTQRDDNVIYILCNGMPSDTYRPNSPFLFMRFEPDGYEKFLTMDDDQVVSFEYEEPWEDVDWPEHAAAAPRYNSFTFIDENTLETTMDQKFYDETEQVWKDVSLFAVFSKITYPDYNPPNY